MIYVITIYVICATFVEFLNGTTGKNLDPLV